METLASSPREQIEAIAEAIVNGTYSKRAVISAEDRDPSELFLADLRKLDSIIITSTLLFRETLQAVQTLRLQFVDSGMCADLCLHDTNGKTLKHNPIAHTLYNHKDCALIFASDKGGLLFLPMELLRGVLRFKQWHVLLTGEVLQSVTGTGFDSPMDAPLSEQPTTATSGRLRDEAIPGSRGVSNKVKRGPAATGVKGT